MSTVAPTPLLDFYVRLAEDADLLVQFERDPEATLERAGFSGDEVAMLLEGDLDTIRVTLRDETRPHFENVRSGEHTEDDDDGPGEHTGDEEGPGEHTGDDGEGGGEHHPDGPGEHHPDEGGEHHPGEHHPGEHHPDEGGEHHPDDDDDPGEHTGDE
jgi:hypothetical protein